MSRNVRFFQLLLASSYSRSTPVYLYNYIFRGGKFSVKSSVPCLNNGTHQEWRYCGHLVAAVSFAKVFQSLGLKSEKNPEIKEHLNRAKELLQNGKEKEASDLYNQALTMAVSAEDEEDIYYIKKKLAIIAFNSKLYPDAEKLFLEVREYFCQKGVSSNDLQIMYIDLRLAEVYDNLQNYQKAEEHYKVCAKNVKSILPHRSDPELMEFWLLFLTSRAHYHLHRGTYEKASKYFTKAYETCLHAKGEMNEQTVMLLQQLGSVCYQKGDVEKAVTYLRKAVDLGKHLPGFAQLSNAYVSLGNVLLKQGLVEEAKSMCNQGLKNAVRHKYDHGISESNTCLEEVLEATS